VLYYDLLLVISQKNSETQKNYHCFIHRRRASGVDYDYCGSLVLGDFFSPPYGATKMHI
jgi:hypothetical protein